MEMNFGEYLEEGTKKIMEIVSSPEIGEEEKRVIVEAFSNELSNHVGNTGNLEDYEPLLYGVSIRYIDEKISATLSNQNTPYDEYEKTIKLCSRQQELMNLFQNRKWALPEIQNSNLENCIETLQKRRESTSISSRILKEDRQIEELSRSAQKDLSVKNCDAVLDLLTELDKDITLCKSRRVAVPAINNKDTKKVRKKITDLRKVAEQKEALYQNIYDIELRIDGLISLQKSTFQQWQEVVRLCQRQAGLLSNCNKNQWPLPSIKYGNPNEVAEKYKHYLAMDELDKTLLSERDSLSSKKKYRVFFDNCEKQRKNFEICITNGWEIPTLSVRDPGGLSNAIHAEKRKKERARKIKSRLVLAGAVVVCVLALVLFGVHKYRDGKVRIPFDSSYVAGEDLEDIYRELAEAGFENITKKQDNSGWRDSGEVIRVSIDHSDTYSKGDYQSSDVNVVITYSSTGRIYVTDLLKDWKERDNETIQKILNDAGFTNVTAEEVVTSEGEKDGLMAAFSLNGEMYTNEHCYLPENAPIIMSYYVLKIGIGNDSSQFIGQDYEDVVASLKESGFTNVQTQEITSGWAKENTVVGVTVNNIDTYDSSESFDPDVRIVVKYSGENRIDATSVLEGWQSKDYQQLRNLLTSKGFTNISLVEKSTKDKSKNHLVSGITLSSESFTAGDCYLQKAAPIKIEYYVLTIVIGDTVPFEDEQYTDVVANLENMGFSNIQLQRANNIGWWPFHAKEGTIKSFSVNGSTDFSETDSFRYDAEIIIVVHTKKNEGCEDITVIAD